MNITVIAGNVGKDAELRNTQGGDSVLGFSVAVDNGKDKPPTWWDCSVWGKRATSLAPYIKKGTKLTLSGRVSARAHDGKAYLQLSVNDLTFHGGGHQSDAASGDQSSGYGAGGRAMDEDSIPFMPERLV